MLALLAEMARNESETLRERIKSGLALARKRGVLLGRRKGTTLTPEQFLHKHKDIARQLKRGSQFAPRPRSLAKDYRRFSESKPRSLLEVRDVQIIN